MNRPAILERVLPWMMRLGWVGVLAVGWSAIDDATAERSGAVHALALSGGGALWFAGVVAMVVPAVVSLTATRSIVPLALPAGVVVWLGGADTVDASLLLVVAAATVALAFTAEIGRVFVQASAYGDEDRHLLRPPAAYALASMLAWGLWAAAVFAGPLLLAAQRWVVGVPIAALAVGGAVWLWPRWHRLARRWLVYVPVGLVIHDHLVLAETLMLRRTEIGRLQLAPADTEAADLTGPAAGHAIEIQTTESITAIRAATPSDPTGTAIHLTACLVSPTRPGVALAAAGARRLPVG